MFEKRVIIQDDAIIVGKKRVTWDEIVGLREINNQIFNKIHNSLPYAEIFIKGGKVVSFSNLCKYENKSSYSIGLNQGSYSFAAQIIKEKSKNLNPILNNWIEWRLFLLAAITQLIAFGVLFYKGFSIDKIVTDGVLVSLIAFIPGWIWERKTRKKYTG